MSTEATMYAPSPRGSQIFNVATPRGSVLSQAHAANPSSSSPNSNSVPTSNPRLSQSPSQAHAVVLATPAVFYNHSSTTADSSHHHQQSVSSTEMASLPTNLPTPAILPVLTPATFYNTAPDSNRGAPIACFCIHCGVQGPVESARCFPNSDKEHKFSYRGEDEEDKRPPKKLRWIWKLILALILLACYGVTLVYIYKPVDKYLNQEPATAVSVLSATTQKPIPFPGLQICPFNWGMNISDLSVWINAPADNSVAFQSVDFTLTSMHDYDYDLNCYEVNNVAKNALDFSSKRQKVVLVVHVPRSQGVEVLNSNCYPNDCDPSLPSNATILDINPGQDAQGVSIAAFQPNGVPRDAYEADVVFLATGTFSQVSLSFSRTFRYNVNAPEENYTLRASSVPYLPNSYSINFTRNDGGAFKMDEVVFAEIGFGELSFTEVRETMAYESFNAFGDATAIMGFLTGFGVFGGPTFLSLIMDNSRARCWSSLFYQDSK